MKNIILMITIGIAFIQTLNAQQPQNNSIDRYKNTREGNNSFKKGDFTTAEKKFNAATKNDTNKNVANFNLGNTLYKLKKYDKAAEAFANATGGLNADSLSKAWHNLGNSMLAQKKYQESINAFKQALKLKPKDEQTRYNLAYAQTKLKKENSKKNKENKQDKEDKKNKEQNKKQNKKQKEKETTKKDEKDNNNEQEPNPAMSKEEAKRILDALKNNENKIRERMNQRKNKAGFDRSNTKDW
jgi:Ca-activated chloride channel homolog